MTKIAVCGLGLLGRPIAARLLEAGHDVAVWNRTASRAAPLVERGASRAGSPAEAAQGAEVVVTVLSTPEVLEEVTLGARGLAERMGAGSVLLEMSTVGPEAIRRLAPRLPAGVELVDAPVLGSVPQAEAGELKVFVGGSREAYDRLQPLLGALGRPRHVGPLGTGAAMKLVVNSTLPALMAALGEALALADGLALDQEAVLDVLADSSIGATTRSKRRHVESGIYPPNFRLELALKDAHLVREAAERAGIALRIAPAARAWLAEADERGLGDLDYSAVIAHIRGLDAALDGGGGTGGAA